VEYPEDAHGSLSEWELNQLLFADQRLMKNKYTIPP